mmetsp:Transcript_80981/g.223991  ORF Transcript_80981/g.223991 Transcript_80981/m.223991 type:complete len:335 (+) Transcript_80981:209-1213(+)
MTKVSVPRRPGQRHTPIAAASAACGWSRQIPPPRPGTAHAFAGARWRQAPVLTRQPPGAPKPQALGFCSPRGSPGRPLAGLRRGSGRASRRPQHRQHRYRHGRWLQQPRLGVPRGRPRGARPLVRAKLLPQMPPAAWACRGPDSGEARCRGPICGGWPPESAWPAQTACAVAWTLPPRRSPRRWRHRGLRVRKGGLPRGCGRSRSWSGTWRSLSPAATARPCAPTAAPRQRSALALRRLRAARHRHAGAARRPPGGGGRLHHPWRRACPVARAAAAAVSVAAAVPRGRAPEAGCLRPRRCASAGPPPPPAALPGAASGAPPAAKPPARPLPRQP